MADEIVQYMVEKCSAATINGWRDAVFAAHISSVSEPTTITGITNDGATMSMVVNANAADRTRFLAQCRAALAALAGDSLPAGPGIKLDFSTRCAST